ncbi:Glucan endo-1,3-beta-glucosidase [Cytospora mali]|uniref:Glucan endo-1,3-beta-glucosidase n=1 Tax=Cytospora mali TaxID=578113 RepID=A0A194VD62_CYTMA|nr:Glucan endo-1,3-beta-glucosidase [Valsa mali var. pyri (nom. inval.)]
MFPSTFLAVAGTTLLATQSLAHVIPERANARSVLTPDSVRRGISPRQSASASAGGATLDIKITNSASGKMYAYIMGEDETSGKHVFFQDGSTSWYYPSASGSTRARSANTAIDVTSNKLAIEVDGNGTKTITLPQYLNSGRVYIGAKPMTFMMDTSGNLVEPSPVDTSDANYDFAWGIVELAWSSNELAADLSYVDSVALALGLKVTTTDGQEYYDAGLPAGSLQKVCSELAAVSDDWGNTCVKGSGGDLIRALAPAKYVSANSAGSLSTFYDSYIDKVWQKYATSTLTVNTEVSTWGPNVTCKVSGGGNGSALVCNQPDGNTYNYNKPTTMDVLGCNSGPFTSQGSNDYQSRTWPRLCAAFTRSTLLLDGGDVTPSSQIGASRYYTGGVTNHFSRIVHETVTPGKTGTGAYAFAFDDVNAPGTGENESGMFQVGNAKSMEIMVRGT